jgi:hypothetical protein
MHLVIAFVAALEGQALPPTPHLDRLLATWSVMARDDADDTSPDLPHERVLARALGWPADAPWPWAARQAAVDGIDVGTLAWGLLSPAHWQLGAQAVHLADPAALDLDEPTSRALLEVLRPWFEEEGFTVAWGDPLRWYAAHPSLAQLRTASLDRVVGRNVAPWRLTQTDARLIRRLQDETQMLLYDHPLNLEREERGLFAVNSFWLSGCGVRRPETPHDVVIDDRLRGPTLRNDSVAWQVAWQQVDTQIAQGGFTRLTLCGDKNAVTLAPSSTKFRPFWRRWTAPQPGLRAIVDGL